MAIIRGRYLEWATKAHDVYEVDKKKRVFVFTHLVVANRVRMEPAPSGRRGTERFTLSERERERVMALL